MEVMANENQTELKMTLKPKPREQEARNYAKILRARADLEAWPEKYTFALEIEEFSGWLFCDGGWVLLIIGAGFLYVIYDAMRPWGWIDIGVLFLSFFPAWLFCQILVFSVEKAIPYHKLNEDDRKSIVRRMNSLVWKGTIIACFVITLAVHLGLMWR